jgi:hypothetical protein
VSEVRDVQVVTCEAGRKGICGYIERRELEDMVVIAP